MCNLVRKSPQNVEKMAQLPGGERCVKSCHVSGCHGFVSVLKEVLSGVEKLTRSSF